MLGEFRNQLERLNAGTVQLRDALPMDIGADLAPALADMENSLAGLAGLMSCLDAVTTPGQQVISDLDDVIERALTMAGPWLRSDVRIAPTSASLWAAAWARSEIATAPSNARWRRLS